MLTIVTGPRICKECGKGFKLTRKHKVYCSVKCNRRGQEKIGSEWYLKHKQTVLKRQKANPNKPRVQRKATLKKKYGLTLADYDSMFESQNGACAICGGQQTYKLLAVDHCHITGKVRGLLCSKCNSILGYVSDNVGTLQNAIKYLRSYA